MEPTGGVGLGAGPTWRHRQLRHVHHLTAHAHLNPTAGAVILDSVVNEVINYFFNSRIIAGHRDRLAIGDDAYTPEVQADITEAFRVNVSNGQVSRPVDWMENMIPQVWDSAFGRDTYEW